MIWTDESVEELKRMWDRGMTTGQIAKALSVTKNSIIGKVHRLCLTARPSPIKKASDASSKKVVKTEKGVKIPKEEKKDTEEKSTEVSNIKNIEAGSNSSIEEKNISLVQLDNHTCRWPLGDPRDDDFCFCGKKVKTGQTYCEEHSSIAYVRVGKKV